MKDFSVPEHAPDFKEAKARSRSRLTEFLSAIPKDLDTRDDGIAEQLRRDNSSAKSKLGKIYSLMTEISQAVKPYVACGKGCSDCCKMNVSISVIEAERLSAVTQKLMVRVFCFPSAFRNAGGWPMERRDFPANTVDEHATWTLVYWLAARGD